MTSAVISFAHNTKMFLYFQIIFTLLIHYQMRGAGVGQAGAGAGHGGQGGVSKSKQGGGLYYDSVTQPSMPGSGALNGNALKSHGGGMLKFEVASIMHVDGELV